jgi:hypothetical protein
VVRVCGCVRSAARGEAGAQCVSTCVLTPATPSPHPGQDPRKALPLWRALYQDGRWLRSLQDTSAAATAAAAVSAAHLGAAGAAPPAGAVPAGPFKGADDLQLPGWLKTAVDQSASMDGGLTLQSVTTARDGTHK